MKPMIIKNKKGKRLDKIKTSLLLFAMVFTTYAQENSLKSTVFSFTPRTKKVEKVTGLAFGLGLNIDKDNTIKEINGINIEVNPLALLIVMFYDPSRGKMEFSTATINGISIGLGESNQNQNITYSGVQMAMYNSGYACNGISANILYNYVSQLNGVHISSISNYSEKANGLFVAIGNKSNKMNGMQLGVINNSDHFKGLQLGVYNTSKTQKGLQIGFWNVNNKRSMPFINW